MVISCQLNLPLHGSWNNSMVERCCPHGKFPLSSMLASPPASNTLEAWLQYPKLITYGAAQLGRSWSMWALILLQTYCMMLDTSRPCCWVCSAATCNWLQGMGRVCQQKVLLFRAVSLRACYPDLSLQNCFAPKQARSTPGCLKLSQFCLNGKIPLFLGRVCCNTISDIC